MVTRPFSLNDNSLVCALFSTYNIYHTFDKNTLEINVYYGSTLVEERKFKVVYGSASKKAVDRTTAKS